MFCVNCLVRYSYGITFNEKETFFFGESRSRIDVFQGSPGPLSCGVWTAVFGVAALRENKVIRGNV